MSLIKPQIYPKRCHNRIKQMCEDQIIAKMLVLAGAPGKVTNCFWKAPAAHWYEVDSLPLAWLCSEIVRF